MASALARSLSLARTSRAPRSLSSLKRPFSIPTSVLESDDAPLRRTERRTKSVLEENVDDDDLFSLLTEPNDTEDTPSLGHHLLMEKRLVLHYLRLIEHEMPKLVAYRQPFIPPNSKETPLYVKSTHYQGQAHPASAKRAIVVAVDDLPLMDADSSHTIKLLAGPRWTPNPPRDAGVMENEAWGNGYIKISSDTYPNPDMNLRWVTEALDRLVTETNSSKKEFVDLPIDMRHVYSKVRKAKRGDHRGVRPLRPVSLADFPKEWLPSTTQP